MIVCYTQIFSNSTIAYRSEVTGELQYKLVPESDIVDTITVLTNKLKDPDITLIGNSVFCEKYKNEIIEQSALKYGINNLNVEVR